MNLKKTLILSALFCSINVFAQEWEWMRQANGLQNDYTSAVFTDDSGYVYSTGRSKFNVTFSDSVAPITPDYYGLTDAFITKYAPNGDLQWANVMGGDDSDWGWATFVDDSGYVYVTGEFSNTATFGPDVLVSSGGRDVFISKIAPNGDFVWTSSFGDIDHDKGYAIVADKSGNVYVSGYMKGEVTIGTKTLGVPSKFNAFFVKLDQNGEFLDFYTFESAFYSRVNDLVINENQDIFICGEYTKTATFDTITKPGTSTTWPDAFVAKYDTSMAVQWVRTGVGPFYNVAYGCDFSDDHIYTAGYFCYTFDLGDTTITYNATASGTTNILAAKDMYVAKYDLDGNFEWVKGIGYEGAEIGYAIDATPSNEVYFTGTFQDSVYFDDDLLIPEGSTDIFVCKLDAEGEVLWVKQNGIDTIEYGYGIAVDQWENIFVGGTNTAGCDFDEFTLSTVSGTYDAFTGKLTQHPNPMDNLTGVPCTGDTLKIEIDAITTPLEFEWNITGSPTGYFEENIYYIPIVDPSIILTGYVVVSNNMFDDTLYISEIINAVDPTPFTLGEDTTICDYILDYTISGPGTGEYYFWSTGDEGSTMNEIVVNTSGDYSLEYTNDDGCKSNDTINVNFVDCLSLDEFEENIITYYVHDKVVVLTADKLMNEIIIYDLSGKRVVQMTLNDFHTVLNLNHVQHGAYLLDVRMSNGRRKNIKIVL